MQNKLFEKKTKKKQKKKTSQSAFAHLVLLCNTCLEIKSGRIITEAICYFQSVENSLLQPVCIGNLIGSVKIPSGM